MVEGISKKFEFSVRNLIRKNRVAVVAAINVNKDRPDVSIVYLDFGESTENEEGMKRIEKITLPTKRIVSEKLAIQDIVSISRLGKFSKTASLEDLQMIGADTDKIYANFIDWISHQHRRERATEMDEILRKANS